MNRLTSILRNSLVVLLALLMQGPALFTQELAWVTMLVSYTQERGWKQGVVETFDGEHPCELCKAAEKLRQAEEKENEPTPALPLSGSLVWTSMVLPGERIEAPSPRCLELDPTSAAAWRDLLGKRRDCPDTPPPKRG